MHRVAAARETEPLREVGSSVLQVFDGTGRVSVGDQSWSVQRGDMFVVPSWTPWSVVSDAGQDGSDSACLDLFRFSDAPIFDALHLYRSEKA
jgi:gentisate 1,2-dioxygenase